MPARDASPPRKRSASHTRGGPMPLRWPYRRFSRDPGRERPPLQRRRSMPFGQMMALRQARLRAAAKAKKRAVAFAEREAKANAKTARRMEGYNVISSATQENRDGIKRS